MAYRSRQSSARADAHVIASVAADLQRVGAPESVAPVDDDTAMVAPLLAFADVGLPEALG